MKKLTAKIIFDIILAVLLIILMIYSLTGAYWHEILGLVFAGLFVIHILYNIPLLKRTCPKLFTKSGRSITVKYILDLALLFFMMLTILSGILISKFVLTSDPFTAYDIPLWTWIHSWSAYLTLIIISVHIGLHWKMAMAVISRPFRKLAGTSAAPGLLRAGRIVKNLAAAGVILYGIFASANYDLPSYTSVSDNGSSGDTKNTFSSSSDSNASQVSYDTTSSSMSLEEYLGSLYCTGCSRGCSLLSPMCSVGVQQAQAAEEEYYNTYSSEDPSDSAQEDPSADGNSDSSSSSVTAADTENENGLGNILPIMGMWIGGTYYVSEIPGRRRMKNRRRTEEKTDR